MEVKKAVPKVEARLELNQIPRVEPWGTKSTRKRKRNTKLKTTGRKGN